MTTYQACWRDRPDRATIRYHQSTGCEVGHKTNRALFWHARTCEPRIS